LAVAALLLAQAGLLWWHVNYASVTTDEFGHLPLALAYVRSGNPRFLLMNPPSGPALAALALAGDAGANLGLTPAWARSFPPVDDTFFWTMGEWFQKWNRDNYAVLYFKPRLLIAGLTLCLSMLAYFLARLLAGRRAGLTALVLFAFSPDFLAHGSLVTTDLAAAFAAVFFVLAFHLYSRRRRWWLLPLPGVAIGLLLLAKHSCLIFLPLAPVFLWRREDEASREGGRVLSRRFGRLAVELAAVGAIGWLVATAPYRLGIDSSYPMPPSADVGVPPNRLHRLVFALSWPMPEAWREALKLQLRDAGRPWPTFFMGRVRLEPSFWYYPVAFLLKTPLALLLLLLVAKVRAGVGLRSRDPVTRSALFWAGLPAAYFYLLLCLLPAKQYGIRLALPGLGLLLIFVAARCGKVREGAAPAGLPDGTTSSPGGAKLMQMKTLLLAALLIYYAIDLLIAAPNFIGYFNEVAGGPGPSHHGRRYLADSNLDWGQDWKELARWQRSQGNGELPLARFGLLDPALYGIKYEEVACPLPSGTMAVSANLLDGIDPFRPPRPCLQSLSARRPDGQVGTSILIYRRP
jgi:hypothetical protein